MKSEDTLLAGIAGFVDTLSFVALYGLFTAHVTGNFVLIGAGFGGYGQGILLKLAVFPAFVAGVAGSSMLVSALPRHHVRHGARLLHALQALLMLGFCLAGVVATPVDAPDNLAVVAAGMLGAFAMGVQNAHPRLIGRPGVPNTVMTGNVTQAILDWVAMMSPGASASTRNAARVRIAKLVPAIVAFALGAAAGALGWRHFGFWALVAPALALGALVFVTDDVPEASQT